MKKILALLLVIATLCFCLTSCNEDIIESLQMHKEEFIRENSYVNKTVGAVTLDMYVICNDVSDDAKETVPRQINQETVSLYNTTLNLHYLKASDYQNTVNTNLSTADIILVNDSTWMNQLVQSGKLANLHDFFGTETYGSLNVVIASSLIEKATVGDACYCVPNNHVISPYTYVKINIDKIHKEYHYTLADLRNMTTQTQIDTLKSQLSDAGLTNVDDYVVVYQGNYEDRLTEDNGYVCNILTYPTVTEAQVYSSAFAVVEQSVHKCLCGYIYDDEVESVKFNALADNFRCPNCNSRKSKFSESTKNDRAFEIIYAFNTNETLRNLLQYGVERTNYELVDVLKTDGSGEVDYQSVNRLGGKDTYDMDLLYTGDLFHAYYCDDLGYTKTVKEYGLLQNMESVAAVTPD